ncbi:MAG TPA: MotA/TolQ/ExbB proton channel family protein [Burkholderiaceae bacterium]|nr:MotA/TolQ/ExbB proton channel family protein [Burkholderiaceae bacterium]
MSEAFGFEHFWMQADGLIRANVYLLFAMSLASWFLIFLKTWSSIRARRALRSLDAFWSAPSIDQALATLAAKDSEALLAPLARVAIEAARQPSGGASAWSSRSDRLTRALRSAIQAATERLESGLTVLASVGATAPFVGLLGTVWGIYHALLNIASSGSLSIDKVAGPVGEALIMTAFGLGVAIPAVLAYNSFARANRLVIARIDGFAHDLHALLAEPEANE